MTKSANRVLRERHMAPPSTSPSQTSVEITKQPMTLANALHFSSSSSEMEATEFPDHCSLTMELFDVCWFFRSPFCGSLKNNLQSSLKEASSMDYAAEETEIPAEDHRDEKPATIASASVPVKSLERVLSLSSRATKRQRADRKSLRHTCSNLESFLQSSSEGLTIPRRPPRDARVFENIVKYVRSNHQAITGDGFRWSSTGGKKWRSLSDLDSKEIQGFKDLGFVFNDDARNSIAVETIRGFQPSEQINEARISRNHSPPPSLDWFGASSPADRKNNLRLWAQVVASSVRQEC